MGAFVSARHGATWLQRLILAGGLVSIAGLGLVTSGPVAAAGLVLTPFFLTHVLFILGAALERPSDPPDARAHGPVPDWPIYTVLVPLYREAAVARQLVQTLSALDYPPDRLQVLLLLEADDVNTRTALHAADLPDHFHLVVVPPGGPRTKPNALNHGLAATTGALLTVFDAEDLPDPDQLKRAAATFAMLPPTTACLQARLVIDNAPDGWLSLMMSIEYAGLFDATKCGLAAMGLPVALGGTSNHFRVEALRHLGGWDAWNVTEDADLGLRLAAAGLEIADLPSVTLEEAPFHFSAWFAQRRRWHKGFLQTLVSHGQVPRRAIRSMGLFNWIGGMIQISGTVIGALLFPLFTFYVLWAASTGALFDNASWAAAVQNTTALWVAVCGAMTVVVPTLIGLKRRRIWHLAPWLLTLPAYLLLISAAAWFAILDYWRAPFVWNKTEHGLGTRRPDMFKSRRAAHS